MFEKQQALPVRSSQTSVALIGVLLPFNLTFHIGIQVQLMKQSWDCLEDTKCLLVYLSSSIHGSPHPTVCHTPGCPLVRKNPGCPGTLSQGVYPKQKTIKDYFVGLLCTSTLPSEIYYSFLFSRTRLAAFREVTPVELPNCNLIKGIGMYMDEEVSNFKCKDIISLYVLLMLQFNFVKNYSIDSGV